MSRNPDDLLQQAIAAARAGQKDEAKNLLVQVLKANPRSEQAWIWMSATVETRGERVHCLRQVLAINPDNQLAQKGLQALGALEEAAPPAPQPEPEAEEPEPEAESEQAEEAESFEEEAAPAYEPEPTYEPEPAPEDTFPPEEEAPPPVRVQEPPRPRRPKQAPLPPPPVPDGIPLVDQNVVMHAQRAADEILTTIRRAEQPVNLGIDWAKPEKLQAAPRRGGIDLRPSPMMLAIGGAVVLVIAIVFLTARLIGNAQEQRRLANITPSPSPTITLTPLPTRTPRPTRTPTPSGGEFIGEPTLRAPDAPRGEVRFGITATPPYVATGHPASPRMNEAIQAYHEGRYQDALDLIEIARTVDVTIDSYYYEAMSRIKLGQFAEAQNAVTAGLDLESGFAPLYYAQGLLYLEEDSLARAQQSFERAIQLDPSFVDPRLALADTYLQEGNAQLALETALAAHDVREFDVNVLATVSQAYLATGDLENGAAYANLAYYIDPGSAGAAAAQARGRLALGYDELAAIGLENYMDQVDEGSAEIWALLGEAYGKLGRIEDAQSAYARAIQLSDDVTVALIGRGLFYLRAERYQEALDDLAQAVENGTRLPDVLLGYGQAAYALGDYQTAIDSAETVLENNPENVDAVILAALAASEADLDAEDTVALVNDAFNSGAPLTLEQQALLYEARARALYQLERYNEARNDMEQALFVAETGTRHYYNALIRAQQGEIEQAILELEWVKALDASYHYPFSAELDQQLEDLYQQREDETGS